MVAVYPPSMDAVLIWSKAFPDDTPEITQALLLKASIKEITNSHLPMQETGETFLVKLVTGIIFHFFHQNARYYSKNHYL